MLNQVISSTGGAQNFFANVSIGYSHGMYYVFSSGLECKVKNKHTIDAKIMPQIEKIH